MPQDSKQNDLAAYSAPNGPLDDVNVRLLTELHANPRVTMSALARRVGMSAPAVTERVQRMERAGVITGYQLNVAPEALGLPVAAFTRIRPTPGQLPRVAKLAAELPQVSECHRITGEDCFLVKIHAPTVADLETILDRFAPHGQTTTSIVVSTPVPPRPLPVPTQAPYPPHPPHPPRPSGPPRPSAGPSEEGKPPPEERKPPQDQAS
ncbi:Lrp/AsnC family transcriptional regulator [Streptomyces sp. B6B3]|uniref:Lrp/AsnC family transcriptional regulator n=1 Tax=Streptomyces sp. B6B3 TaxID=3153570 RepID=UPI00325ECC14